MFDRPVHYIESTTYAGNGTILDEGPRFWQSESTLRHWIIWSPAHLALSDDQDIFESLIDGDRLPEFWGYLVFGLLACTWLDMPVSRWPEMTSLILILIALLAVAVAAKSGASHHGGGDRAAPWLRPPGGKTDHYIALC